MEKHVSGLLTVIAVIALMMCALAFGVGYNMAPEKEKIVEKPVVEIKNVTVEKEVEVDMLAIATDAFMKAVEDEEDEAGNDVSVLSENDKKFDEISLYKVYDEYTVAYDGDKAVVDFKVKLKLDIEEATDEKVTYNVIVTFEEGEDTEVEYELA